ncbi:hypothetical protein DFS34DRAFT_399326 [Phlyctochytrium arcticum]|nr:hypothetical protein DFS34DRAFT_399326 [Phlyctochytrium arcticum]
MLKSSAILLTFAAAVIAQGSWNRRVYYDDNTCSTTVNHQIHVFSPQFPCAGSPSPINAFCEIKSKTPARVLSSEGTGCETVADNTKLDDAAYFPPAGQGAKAPGGNYMVVNQYLTTLTGAQACSVGKGDVSVTQTMWAADGKCHVMEPGMYFKASCNSQAGVVEYCNDDECKECPSAKAQSFLADCTTIFQGQPSKSICILAAGNVDQPLPAINGSTTPLPTGTVTQPAAGTPTGTTSPTGTGAPAKNGAVGGGSTTWTYLVGMAIAPLMSLF